MSAPASPPPQTTTTAPTTTSTLPINTNHCRFCNHLLLATTQTVSSLSRRKEPARDGALILPLPSPKTSAQTSDEKEQESGTGTGSGSSDQTQQQQHYSILLSTAVPDRRATMVRREDGFEKRWFLRCGRCRVVVGYFLDAVHFPAQNPTGKEAGGEDEEDEEEAERAKVVYLLPGALVETDDMGEPEKMKAIDREWSGWLP